MSLLSFVPQDKPPAAGPQAKPALLVTDAEKATPWSFAKMTAPKFPALPAAKDVEGVPCHEVELEWTRGKSKVWIYVPKDAKARSLPCVLIAPAGSNMLFGMDLGDGDRKEHLPWAKAGFVVVAYEVEGVMPEDDEQTDENIFRQMRRYTDCWAGMQNGKAALDYALANVPAIDPTKVIAAGHSSAGTTALLFGAHEPRVRGVAAFMPCTDVVKRLPKEAQDMGEKEIPGFRNFLARSSPLSHVANYRAPMFVFGADDDSNVPIGETRAFVAALEKAKKTVTFDHVATGDHYEPMLDPGIGRAIVWAQTLFAGKAAAPAVPKQDGGGKKG